MGFVENWQVVQRKEGKVDGLNRKGLLRIVLESLVKAGEEVYEEGRVSKEVVDV